MTFAEQATQPLHPGGEFYPGQHEQDSAATATATAAAAADLSSVTAGISNSQMTE